MDATFWHEITERDHADAKTASCKKVILLPLSLLFFFIFFNLLSPFFLYYLLLIDYPKPFLHHLSDRWSAVAFLHVFFSLCIDIHSYFVERFRSQSNKVGLTKLTLSSFGHRPYTTPLYERREYFEPEEVELRELRGGAKLTLQLYRKFATLY